MSAHLAKKMSTIVLRIGTERFSADLRADKAPKTVESLLRVLPYKSKVIHARFSGEAMWIPLPSNFPVYIKFENQTSYPSRGELLYYPGFVSDKEILIPYGSAVFSSKVGLLPGNHFATITSESLPRLEKVGNTVLWEGAKTITIERGD
jgi:hypothetical protein